MKMFLKVTKMDFSQQEQNLKTQHTTHTHTQSMKLLKPDSTCEFCRSQGKCGQMCTFLK